MSLAALGVAALAYARLRTGAQGTLLLLIAALATVAGADDGAAHIAVDRLGGGEDLNPLYRRAARGAASVWLVPGWGVSETDAAAVGRGLAEDEADLLDEAREQGEVTGWE